MISKIIPDFSISQIAHSGQCFRINEINQSKVWQVIAFGKLLKIQQQENNIVYFDCSAEDFSEIWVDYFDLKRDYNKIKNIIFKLNDPYLIEAIKYGHGLRMLRQDLWEMIITSIITQQNNIPRIKSIIERLCAPYGLNFPSADILASFTEEHYKQLGLGYRAKYILDVARAVDNNQLNLNKLEKMTYKEAIKYLKQFPGIGDKVANCIALFGLHKTEAFPEDVWIKRIIKEQYGSKFDISYFQEYAGIVQQYMFFYERNKNKRLA